MSDIKKKFRDIFGSKISEEDNSNEKVQAETIADSTDENTVDNVNEDTVADETEDAPCDGENTSGEAFEDAVAEDDVQIYGNADETADDSAEIEHDAKNYFNSTYQDSIEERIKSIRENALNTYAKDESFDEPAEELVHEDVFSDNTPENSENGYVEGEGVYSDDEISDDAPVYDSENVYDNSEENVKESGSQNYDMSQLLKILKSDGETEDDEDDYGKKKKKSKITYDTETDIEAVSSEFDDDTNEYSHDFEYKDALQSADLYKNFRKSAVVATISVILTFVFTLLCIWMESGHGAGLPFSHMMKPGYYGRVYAMVCLQMLAFCVIFNLDGFSRGIKKLSIKKAAPEAVAVVSVAVCALHTVYTAVFNYNGSDYTTFCLAGCVVTLFLSINNFVKAYTRFKGFTIVLAKKPKFTTVKLDALSEENNVFAKYLSEESDVLNISKTEAVSDFVKNSYTIPKALSSCNFLVYLSLILSIVTVVARLVILNTGVYDAVTGGVSVFVFACPISYLLASALPYFITSGRVGKMRNAIIGEAACDTFENAGVISFDDTEVFSPKTVKVTSIKTYNNNRIDMVIVQMAKIFNKLGGPLSHVFASSVQVDIGPDDNVMVIESSKDGVHLTVDGEDVLIGTGNYLRLFDIECPVDDSDESETRALTSILYLVTGNVLAAKFYIKYSLNRKFEGVLKGLYDAGVCCGVRTNDPGVDNNLVSANLKGANYPISVIQKPAKDIGKIEETSSGALVGITGIHSFLLSFIMLDKLRGTYKTNTVFSILATVIGLAVSMALVFLGFKIGVWTAILFQLFWIIPIFLVSFFRK